MMNPVKLVSTLLLFCSFAIGFSLTTQRKTIRLAEGQDLFSRAPLSLELSLPQEEGIALFFLSFNCPCAINCIDKIKERVQDIKKAGYLPYAVSTDQKSSAADRRKFFEAIDLQMPVIDDISGAFVKTFQVLTASEMRFINRQGQQIYSGAIQSAKSEFLDIITDSLLAKKMPPITSGRGFGCALNPELIGI